MLQHLIFLCLVALPSVSAAQLPPFTCKGQLLYVSEGQLYELRPDAQKGYVSIPFPFHTGFYAVDGIAYCRSDHYLYGIIDNVTYHSFCRIGANGKAEVLIERMSVPNESYPIGTFSGDGRYYWGGGRNNTPPFDINIWIIKIDVLSPDYRLELKEITNPKQISCVDLATEPLMGTVYGFDNIKKELIAFDLETLGHTIKFSIPDMARAAGLMFDKDGKLIATEWLVGQKDRIRILDLHTQTIEGPWPTNQENIEDACSCPYSVFFRQTVSPSSVAACGKAVFTFKISDFGDIPQKKIDFLDTFPAGFQVLKVLRNPYGGQVGGIGTHTLSIKDMALKKGVDSIQVEVFVPADKQGGYANQGWLGGLDLKTANDSRNRLPSDNPATAAEDDPTFLNVVSLGTLASEQSYQLCPDSNLVLRPVPSAQGFSMLWDNGSRDTVRTVRSPGTYRVTVSSGCGATTIAIAVNLNPLNVSLGEDRIVSWGDTVSLQPSVGGNPITYKWSITPNEALCDTCPTITMPIYVPKTAQLWAADSTGCAASDAIQIRPSLDIFAPNAVAPHTGGANSVFYLQSKRPLTVKNFQVWDRWGELVFSKQHFLTNDPSNGWDGTFSGGATALGVFIWFAEIETSQSTSEKVSGDVTVVR